MSQTFEEARDMAKEFLLSGMPISRKDEGGEQLKVMYDHINRILTGHKSTIRSAIKDYLDTDDIDAFVLSLLPIHYEIWYEAYAPYWLEHCTPVSLTDAEAEFTCYNDLIDMYWAGKWQEWKKKDELAVTIMLPPTKGLILHAYKTEMENLNNYLSTHAAGKDRSLAASTISEKGDGYVQ